MPNYVVRTSFIADDKMSAQMQQLRAQVEPLNRLAGRMGHKLQKSANLVPAILKSMVIARAVSSGISMLTSGIRGAVQEYIDLDQALVSTGAVFPETIRKGTESFTELEAAARKIGAETEYTSVQAAEGLRFLAMAGFDAKQAIAALPQMVDLATASDMDFARATDIATDALGAFGMAAKDPAVLTANLTRLNDVMARTVTTSNLTLEDLFQTMKYAGPVFKAGGQSLETFSSAAGLLSNAGIKGSKGGTVLKNMMLRLIGPPKKAAEALHKMGVKISKLGKIRNFYDILQDLRTGMKGMTDQQRLATSEVLFGKWAVAGANVLLAQSVGAHKDYERAIKNSTGALKEMSDATRQGLDKKLDILKSRFDDIGISVVKTFHEKFPTAIDDAIAALDGLDINEIVESVKKLIDFVVGLSKVLYALRGPITLVMTLFGMMKLLLKVNAIVEFSTALLQTLAPALFGAAKAQTALNLAMFANPIGLIITAVLLLAVAIGLLIFYWDDIDAEMKATFETMKTGESVFSKFASGAAASLGWQLEGMIRGFNELRASIMKAWLAMSRFLAGEGGNVKLGIQHDLMVEQQTKTGRFAQAPGTMAAEMALATTQAMAAGAKGVLSTAWGEGQGVRLANKSADRPREEVSYQNPNFMQAFNTKESELFEVTVRNEFNGFPEGFGPLVKSVANAERKGPPKIAGWMGKQ